VKRYQVFLHHFLTPMVTIVITASLNVGLRVVGKWHFIDHCTVTEFLLVTVLCAFLPCLAVGSLAACAPRRLLPSRAGRTVLVAAYGLAWLLSSFWVAASFAEFMGGEDWTRKEILLELVLDTPWALPLLVAGGLFLAWGGRNLCRAGQAQAGASGTGPEGPG
jgi:anaerobic C4-dicarboxylate transporter